MTSAQWIILCRFMLCAIRWMSHRDPDRRAGSFNYEQLADDVAASFGEEEKKL